MDSKVIDQCLKKVSFHINKVNEYLEKGLLYLNDDCETIEEVHKKYDPNRFKIKSQQQIILSMEAIEVLKNCTVEGTIVKLPPQQLSREDYVAVKNKLELIGGKWKGGKIAGFVFPTDPTELLAQIANGEKRNLKKEFQFFGSPDSLCDEMVEDAGIEEYDMVLEPSAGQGAIIKAIHRKHPKILVHYCELMDINRTFLSKLNNVQYLTDNFLKLGRSKTTTGVFHKIIMNPPFGKNQDVTHILQAWDCLTPGGRIVTMASKHWQYSSNNKEKEFKKWLDSINSYVQDIKAGTFKESGTTIATVKIIINK